MVSMIGQAGPPWDGDVPLNCNNLNSMGLLQIYETVLDRGIKFKGITKDADIDQALMLAANRIADLYLLLGNEAYADAGNPTIAFSLQNGVVGRNASSLFSFMNQTKDLLEEELCLLRGRDDTYVEGVKTYPVYNRLYWNFSKGEGEVAYALNYNLVDAKGDDNGDGGVFVNDAAKMYPQGHGDAWGHYLTAIKKYYGLLRNEYFTWQPHPEVTLIGQVPVTVYYRDEQRFADIAAAKARVGAEIVNLTYRSRYVEDPKTRWHANRDVHTDPTTTPPQPRAWGTHDWACRAGQGAYFDWVVCNAMLPVESKEKGVGKIDRSTVPELQEIAISYQQIQEQTDDVDQGLNPLGLASDVVVFDMDSSEVDRGKTHFEQIHDRAMAALNNALTAFNHATESTQILRQQANSIASFQGSAQDREDDFKNQLISIFGYPYPDDIGRGKTYPLGYDGPDLYHYMYIDRSNLAPNGLGPATEKTIYVITPEFHEWDKLKETKIAVKYHFSADGLTLVKPDTWTRKRPAPGELQTAQTDLILAVARFQQSLGRYQNFIKEIEDKAQLLLDQHSSDAKQISILNESLTEQIALNAGIVAAKGVELGFRTVGDISTATAKSLAEALPIVNGVIAGLADGTIDDFTSIIRGAILGAGAAVSQTNYVLADVASLTGLGLSVGKEIAQIEKNIETTKLQQGGPISSKLAELQELIQSEAVYRKELLTMQETMNQMLGRYQSVLQRGLRVLKERHNFRARTATKTAQYRFNDMGFRLFRADAVQKYYDLFDLSSQYVYLAAKAYAYELNLSEDRIRDMLQRIVRARSLGPILSGSPQPEGLLGDPGLADPMARMKINWDYVEAPQLGFNSPDNEINRFSLRWELLRIPIGQAGDTQWQKKLESYKISDLSKDPHFMQYCRYLNETPGPALKIPFSTTVQPGKNFFGKDLQGGDSAYDSTQFSTKIRSLGIWFSNFDNVSDGMANTPRVYLVPIGSDCLRAPDGDMERQWNVVDQKLPLPLPISVSDLDQSSWIPRIDTLGKLYGGLGSSRRFSMLRAYHDSGNFKEEEMISNSRLVGRSVSNTQWYLIIPGQSLHSEPDEGLKRFINKVSDIKILIKSYSYSGN